MNRNQYYCQRCGNLKDDWAENLCPECLEKDRLRKEAKKYFGMPIKMREATKEEKQGVYEYIQSISEKVYTKDEVIAMLKDLRLEIEKIFDNRPLPCSHYQRTLFYGEVDDLILDKINALKEASDA